MNEVLVQDVLGKVMAELDRMQLTIPVELSARHVHLSQTDIDQLFSGKLTPVKELSQPNQFVCRERVRLIGPKGIIDNVAVLGPARAKSQVEISLTDARTLGIEAPIRQSGDTFASPGIALASATGIIGLAEGVIVAGRHIHMPGKYAEQFNFKDRDLVRVHIDSKRPVTMEDVLIRVSDDFKLSMHIDFDEGNACAWEPGVQGIIIPLEEPPGHCHGL